MNFVMQRAPATALRLGTAEKRADAAAYDAAFAAAERQRRLLARVVERDTLAFIALFDHFAPRIKAYMKKLGTGEEDGAELAQETMLAVWRRAATYDPARSAVSSWIFTIARNLRIDALRRDQRRLLDLADPQLLPAAAPAADDQIEVLERQALVRLAMLALPPDQAAVVNLAFYEGLSHGEIAAALAVPLGTVKSRMRLAFQRIRLAVAEAGASAPADPPRAAA
jgi:RNA polymerase sigma-70 factor (ECF subfamily)